MRRRRALVGLVLLAVLIVPGALIVRLSDSSLVVRNIDVGAAAVAVDEQAGFVVVGGSDQHGGPVSVLDGRTGAILRTVSVRGPGERCVLALDERRGRAFVALLDYYGHPGSVNVVDTRRGILLRTLTMKLPAVALAVDERAGRAFILNSGGTSDDKGGPDTWRWVPAWIRQHLPFLQQQKTRLHPAPASMTVIDASR